ncbi:MAG: hypothetical protein LBS80_01760 [Tannerella sp.]|jgi:V/A-type H+-transporting ATPase subunit E|nr:hypothetical protein [Tannerella sp.]
MDTKIKDITDKIYAEGVEKGNQEAGLIIADANAKKEAIVADAENRAKQIIAEAKKQSDELKKHTESELRLFASQAVEALKSEVANLVADRIVTDNVNAATADPAFMQKTILAIAGAYAKDEKIIIQTADAKALTTYFEANAKHLLDGGLKIEQVNGKPASFTLAPANGAYKLSFGEDEFIAFFKDFLRPQLIEMLFAK